MPIPPPPRIPNPDGFEPTDIRQHELQQEVARARLAELNFPPHPITPPRPRSWQWVRTLVLIVVVALVMFYGATLIQAGLLP